jgi:hypothetical protein
MSQSVVVPDVGVIEDVVDGRDGDLVPSVAQNPGHMIRWWTGFGRSNSASLNHAQEVDALGAVAQRLNDGDGSDVEASRSGGHEGVVVKKKLWRFRHDAAPIKIDPAFVPRFPGQEQRQRR